MNKNNFGKIVRLSMVFVSATVAAAGLTAEEVVVSISPLHSLTQAVMGQTGEAILLQPGNASVHSFALKPSHIDKLKQARAVFYIAPEFERYLSNALHLIEDSQVALGNTPELVLLSHRGDHEDHDEHAATDWHIWLDVDNSKKIAFRIAAELSDIFPQHSATYQNNASVLATKLTALDERIKTELVAVKGKPYIVFHDAYQYFERRYGLHRLAVINQRESVSISANRLNRLRHETINDMVFCVFYEPQFSSRTVKTLIEDTPVASAILDPLGADLPLGSGLYFSLMNNLADNINECYHR